MKNQANEQFAQRAYNLFFANSYQDFVVAAMGAAQRLDEENTEALVHHMAKLGTALGTNTKDELLDAWLTHNRAALEKATNLRTAVVMVYGVGYLHAEKVQDAVNEVRAAA